MPTHTQKKKIQHQINTGGSNHRGKSTPWPLSLKYEWQTPRAHKKHTIWSLNSCTNPHCSFASSPTVLGVHDLHSLEQSAVWPGVKYWLTVPFTFANLQRLQTFTNSYFTHYPSIFSELSRLILWSSSAITTVSCFFLSFVIVFVVIEPILSNANWKSKGKWLIINQCLAKEIIKLSRTTPTIKIIYRASELEILLHCGLPNNLSSFFSLSKLLTTVTRHLHRLID